MRVLGNILWIILGGLAIAIGWALVGLILCISIIGIPLGIQAFKMAGLTLTPFGKTVQYGGGVGSALANILWVVLVGWWMALGYLGAAYSTASPLSAFRSASSRSKWPSLRSGRSAHRSTVCELLEITYLQNQRLLLYQRLVVWYSNYGNISPYRKKSSISASLCNISVSETPMNLAKSTDAAKRSCIFKSRLNA